MSQRTEAEDHTLKKLMKVEVFLACAISIIALGGAIGSWVILPYRVSAVEAENKAAQVKLDSIEKRQTSDRELLIRLDERSQKMQDQITRIERATVKP